MAISIRGGSPATSTGTGDPTSVTLNGTRQPNTGDVLVIVHCNDFFLLSNMPTPTVGGSTTGVTSVVDADGGADNAHIKSWRYVVGSTGDLTVEVDETGSADEEKGLFVYVLIGADTTDPIDDAAANTGAPSTDHVAPSVAPDSSDAYLICHANSGGGSSGGNYTEPSGMTEQYDIIVGGAMSTGGATQQLSASGATGTRTFTAASTGFAAISIAVRTIAAGNVPAEVATVGIAANDATVTTTNIRKVADHGSTANVTSATTSVVDLAAGASIVVGNYLIARVALDNAGSSGAAPTLSVTDPGSNTWTVAGPANIDPGAANAGSTCYVAYAKITTGLANGDDVTFTYNVSVPAKAIVVEEWANIHATTPVAVAATTATGTSTTPSVSRTPTVAAQMFYGALSVEGPTGDTFTQDADTTDGSWVTLTRLSTGDATATNNQTINGVYKIVSGTTAQTWNPTITSRDWATVALVFQQAVAATDVNAENAVVAVSAEAPAAQVSAPADAAGITLTAGDATVSIGGDVSVNAEVATVGLASADVAPSVGASAEVAATSLAASDVVLSSLINAEVAALSVVANDVMLSAQASAEGATTSFTANGVTSAVAPSAENASIGVTAPFDATGGSISLELIADSPITFTVLANDATVSTAAQTFANAGVASWTAVVEAVSAGVGAPAAEALLSVVAEAVQVGADVSPTSADVGIVAHDASSQVMRTAETVTLTLAALDGTVQTGSFSSADAEEGALAVTANDVSVVVATTAAEAPIDAVANTAQGSVGVSPTSADVTAVVFGASSSVTCTVEMASLILSALDGTTQTGSTSNANAEAATIGVVAEVLSSRIQTVSELASITLQGEAPSASIAGAVEAALLVATSDSANVQLGVSALAEVAVFIVASNDSSSWISASSEVAVVVLVANSTGITTGTYGWPLEIGEPYTVFLFRVGVPFTVL